MFYTHPHGKLLLSGEYFVLDGALALAVPTRQGQAFSAEAHSVNGVEWESYDHRGALWFRGTLDVLGHSVKSATELEVAERCLELLKAVGMQKPDFQRQLDGIRITTRLDFDRHWGLGTSSTLVAALARWAGIDPYRLLADTFGGSGYDLACAYAEGPVFYQKTTDGPIVESVAFNPEYCDQLWLVYLGQKQNSREGIRLYRERMAGDAGWVAEISGWSRHMAAAGTLESFNEAIRAMESLVSRALGLTPVKDALFSDFDGAVKSLGAWGGDFVLATTEQPADAVRAYFHQKGYSTVVAYSNMVFYENN